MTLLGVILFLGGGLVLLGYRRWVVRGTASAKPAARPGPALPPGGRRAGAAAHHSLERIPRGRPTPRPSPRPRPRRNTAG